MSFLRPEAKAALWRWREALAGAAALALGLWWALGSRPGPLVWIGWAVVLGATALALSGIQRGRFRGAGGGAGVVQVVEGQIAYFGPLDGGVAGLSEISRVTYDPGQRPAHWMISQPGLPDIAIPVNAEGADALFDAFAALPGLRTERMLGVISHPGDHPVVIWQREIASAAVRRLH